MVMGEEEGAEHRKGQEEGLAALGLPQEPQAPPAGNVDQEGVVQEGSNLKDIFML